MKINIDYTRDSLLSEQSKMLLKKHYLLEDEDSPQDGFARAAIAYSFGDEGLAQRIYDYASKRWFMFASPVLSNAPREGDKFKGLPISCFTGDTPIMVKGGYKNIEDIETGDFVYTHKGRLRKVLATKDSISSDLYNLVVDSRRTPLTVTGNHLILTNYGWIRVDELDKNKHLVACNHNIDLEEKDHYINVSNLQTKYTQFKRSVVEDNIIVNDDLAWALGFWFAEGSTSNNGSIVVTHGQSEPCERWVDIMSTNFGIKGAVHKSRNWFSGILCSKNLQEWFDNSFGKGCLDKNISEWILDLPKKQLLKFYEGFYLGDGFKTSNVRAFQLSNPKLVAAIHQILLKLGIRHNLQLKKRLASKSSVEYAGIITERTKYPKRLTGGIAFHDGLEYNRIIKIEKLQLEEKVFDIQVEEDESFLAAGVVAHNCFLTHVEDNLESLISHTAEIRWMSVKGGGVGANWSSVRAVSDKAPGPIPFLKTIDSDMTAYAQGKTRRGSYAAYMDISHPDIEEFLNFRVPTGGDINRKCLNLHNAINITDDFLEALKNNEDWDLIDPHTGAVTSTFNSRELWSRILKTRFRTGEPYLNFIDEANRKMPESLKKQGLKINGSNLCNEIHLPTASERSAVCCLSSLNLELWDQWKDTTIIEDLITFLDNVLQVFVDEAPDALSRARYSATRERSLGLGAMGFHYLLMSKMLAFGSEGAYKLNEEIFSTIQERAIAQSQRLAEEKGAYPDFVEGCGVPVRNSHLIAIAPNANSSIVLSTSPSIEPIASNAYTHRSRIGSHLVKNKYLERILVERGYNSKKTWDSIISNGGSVQHLPFLTNDEKEVFKSADEIDQMDVIDQARVRQQYICQGQSVNLFFKSGAAPKYVNKVHLRAFSEEGPGTPLKSLYYLRTENSQKVSKLTEKQERIALEDYKEVVSEEIEEEVQEVLVCNLDDGECIACQG
jgi:ribonucleoside-diphosphate reductase alpha chain